MTATSINRHIWRAIGEFVGAPEDLARAARASKAWKANVYEHIFGAFLTSYAQEPVLAEKISYLAHLPNEAARMGALFKEIVEDNLWCGKSSPRTLYPPARLAYYTELRAISLVNFLKQLARNIPEAEAFLASLKEEDPQKAEKAKAWLHANKPLLEGCADLWCNDTRYPVYIMPDEIALFIGAIVISFRDARLIALSSKIGDLQNLRRLLLNSNHFCHLPSAITHLPQLEELHIEKSRLSSLPGGFCRLTSLQVLNLRANKLTELPADMGNLSKLSSLQVHVNELTSLPDSIGRLTNLETLWVQYNRLTTLPRTLVSLTALKKFICGKNPIQAVPKALKTCEIEVIRNNPDIKEAAVEPEAPPEPPPLSFWEQAEEFFYTCFSCMKEAIASFLRLLFGRA